jgi:4'-phosphopantetheinyl transferase
MLGERPPPTDEVQVWHTRLAASPEEYTGLEQLLSPAEHDRADRFHRPLDRERYVIGRGRLRRLLAGYLDADPAIVALTDGEHGKPCLAADADAWLRFNVAHSHELAVYAIGKDAEVGVDLECLKAELDVAGLARRTLSAREQQLLAAVPDDEQLPAFVAMWTRKEAVLKAAGVGLKISANACDVEDGFADLGAEHGRWFVHDVTVVDGYRCAVAVGHARTSVPRASSPLVRDEATPLS